MEMGDKVITRAEKNQNCTAQGLCNTRNSTTRETVAVSERCISCRGSTRQRSRVTRRLSKNGESGHQELIAELPPQTVASAPQSRHRAPLGGRDPERRLRESPRGRPRCRPRCRACASAPAVELGGHAACFNSSRVLAEGPTPTGKDVTRARPPTVADAQDSDVAHEELQAGDTVCLPGCPRAEGLTPGHKQRPGLRSWLAGRRRREARDLRLRSCRRWGRGAEPGPAARVPAGGLLCREGQGPHAGLVSPKSRV